jgi:hypothetical protein
MMDKECICGGTGLCQCPPPKIEQVNHPQTLRRQDNPYEVIKVIDDWNLGFLWVITVKYISRAGKKNKEKELEDLKKAMWYLQHHVDNLEKNV